MLFIRLPRLLLGLAPGLWGVVAARIIDGQPALHLHDLLLKLHSIWLTSLLSWLLPAPFSLCLAVLRRGLAGGARVIEEVINAEPAATSTSR